LHFNINHSVYKIKGKRQLIAAKKRPIFLKKHRNSDGFKPTLIETKIFIEPRRFKTAAKEFKIILAPI
jgi:hypothetical protein